MSIQDIAKNNIATIITLVFLAGGVYHNIDSIDTTQSSIKARQTKQDNRHKEAEQELKDDLHELRMTIYEMQKCDH